MEASALVVVFSFLSGGACFIMSLIYRARMKSMQEDYRHYRIYHSKIMVVYIEVAKQNRELIARYYKMKEGIRRDLFVAHQWSTQNQIDWFNKNQLPTAINEDVSQNVLVDKTIEESNQNVKKYDRKINI